MGKRMDLTGQRFGRLVVVARVDRLGQTYWLCRCDCDKQKVVRGGNLRNGRTSSCGCLHRAAVTLLKLTHGHARRGGVRSPEYRAWSAMRQRCTNPKHKKFADYGGRGIRVCDRWESFEAFLEDMGRKPSRELSIERRDNDGNYSPPNCYWADPQEQASNRRPRRKKAA